MHEHRNIGSMSMQQGSNAATSSMIMNRSSSTVEQHTATPPATAGSVQP
jgi:hypothetical protein